MHFFNEESQTDILYEAPARPKNYILNAVLVALITHIGVVALIYAIKSVRQVRQGNLAKANEYAGTAR